MRRVVVTGIGAVTPIGSNAKDTWENMKNGVCGIGPITHFDCTGFKAKVAAEVKDFDPLKYFEKGDLRKNDLYTQYAVAAAAEAMEDSGIAGNIAPERLGVYVGSGVGGIQSTVAQAERLFEGSARVSPFTVPMMITNMAAGTISIQFDAEGPTLPIVTACATSSHAIGEAMRAIRHGYADAVIAGGSEAGICPLAVSGFTACMALSTSEDPKEACMPFDARRNGFVMGEGAGILILEEYEHAKKRGAHIYGELAGYGNTADAYHMTAPHPEAKGIIRAINLAMEEADITADEHTYVNAHGTSTHLNDAAETAAFKACFGDAAYTVSISSTKSMTGHMLGATGAVEAIACLKALEENTVPPTINYKEKDPECDLDYTPNTAKQKELHTAISTNLGFGGHNACLVFRKTEA